MSLLGVNRPFARAHEIAARHRAQRPAPKQLFSRALQNALDETAPSSRGSLYIYEVIGEDWWTGGGVTGKSVVEALSALKGVKTLDVFINSEGGDVFEAKAIHENLKRFDAEKVVHIDGIAASAATFIAMAGDTIITAPAATWMIHEAWSIALGRADDMRSMADVLDLQNRSIAETYAERTGKPVDEMLALMAAETWMSAQEAKDLGFTDEIAREDEDTSAAAAASAKSNLVAAAARTQDRIKSISPADLMVARAEMHRRHRPGQPGTSARPAR